MKNLFVDANIDAFKAKFCPTACSCSATWIWFLTTLVKNQKFLSLDDSDTVSQKLDTPPLNL